MYSSLCYLLLLFISPVQLYWTIIINTQFNIILLKLKSSYALCLGIWDSVDLDSTIYPNTLGTKSADKYCFWPFELAFDKLDIFV